MKQRDKNDCVIAAWATVQGVSYTAAKKHIEKHYANAIDGVGDRELRTLVQREFGDVSFPRLGQDDKGYPVYQTWGQWRSEHQAGRYLISIWTLDPAGSAGRLFGGLFGGKHCIAVVDGKCNDPDVLDLQLVDWWAKKLEGRREVRHQLG